MLVPPKFFLSEGDAWKALQQRVLGTVVVGCSSGFEATPLPWIASNETSERSLRGHVSAANPLVKLLQSPVAAVVLFEVADAYISPSWYPSKEMNGKVVPTWNYVSVHCHGMLERFDTPDLLRRNVEELTSRMENERAEPWKVTNAPSEYVEQLLGGIVGVCLRVNRIEGKAKLSQNRSRTDATGALNGLLHEAPQSAFLSYQRNALNRPTE